MTKAPLNPRRKAFADDWLAHGNATQAYFRAGYKGDYLTARVNAHRMLTNANVIAYIDTKRKALAKRHELSEDSVLRDLTETLILSQAKEDYATSHRILVDLGKHIGMWPNVTKHKIDGMIKHEHSLSTPLDAWMAAKGYVHILEEYVADQKREAIDVEHRELPSGG